MFLGLRTVVFHVREQDLEAAKNWYRQVLGQDPYFDQPFYVGFNVGGFELGIDPDPNAGSPGRGGSAAYWGVADIQASFQRMVELGATPQAEVTDVGGGIKVASFDDPFGNTVGIIENPHFAG